MIRALPLALLVAGLVPPAFAAEIRSGEHADFSRLVIQFDGTFDWEFGRSADGYVLRSEGLEAALDTSRVFTLIPRDRIARIVHDRDGAEFQITLGCDCHGDAFEIRAGRVVIDIKDGKAPENSPFETVLTGSAAPVPVPSSTPPEDLVDTPVPVATRAAPAQFETSAFRDELVRGLSRAMTQGLVGSGLSLDDLLPAPDPTPVEPEPPVQTADPEPERDAPGEIGLSTMTQVEIDRLRRFLNDPVSEAQQCAKLADLDLALDASDPLAKVRHDRAALFDPMGRLSPSVAFDLAVAYLSLGFGAEALEILQLVDQDDPRTAAYQAIAAILEQQSIQTENPFWGQIECRGGYVIWEVLSRNIASRLDEEHLRGIQLHFLELPKQLRRRIGPELGMKLADAGYVEVAQVIRNSLVRAESEDFPALRNLDASMDLETDNPLGAIRHLEELVLSRGDESPGALARLFRAYFAEGMAPPEQFRELLSSYSFELQGSELGHNLAILEVEMLLRNDAAPRALEIVARIEEGERTLSSSETTQLLQASLNVPNDVGFARFVMDRMAFVTSRDISKELFETLLTRVIDAGLLELAQHLLDEAQQKPPELTERLLALHADRQARVLLALDGR
ncbi:hypothetical protein Dshi_3259 [Dinoroseobacter shibae DFL 12 = DSM 16493]|jgi:tetratricopeptide (TPR) repeat protein|uniref:Uncharacterized protein n=1 Tax=Dinoroseobacter shibae (strain DSM 16493 / NCIMB 14021 / DFL 12) TaxID=398580 RepID=A8LMR7_DINSH|nr:hypothetical protein [Dinoroseobacter shibae]ABV94992.1 hypothetical protein Dshi_3259 [Dinoroseobacter shibae DFL 12 = DSM 16493]URF46411.1 hypothetical protein M8008_16760 [Dinoroseobacter shibae]URF50717.1 hypothetical protein M8007_16760 [Dinoroseobacter shibae]